MPYIIDRSNTTIFSEQPVNENSNKFIPNKLSTITKDPTPSVYYPMHDLMSVYTHYDKKSGMNIPTTTLPIRKIN